MTMLTRQWVYPRWIAHRGAGKQAPENTLAAFELGYSYGYRMFECDVKLSADDVAYLMHDAELDRTTNGKGSAIGKTWAELSQLDAGAWHSAKFAGETLPRLDAVASFILGHHCNINLEIKPIPGTEAHTGAIVARQARDLWLGASASQRQSVPPLLSSFSEVALAAARDAAPELPRALLVDHVPHDWRDKLRALDCVALDVNCKRTPDEVITEAQALGYRVLSYTVNDEEKAQHLLRLGVAGIITDEVHVFSPQ
jgi:glycerophosphoryl diester phosphodiesterase